MSKIISSKTGEDAVAHINQGSHSTQRHIYIHVVPSKGGLRDLVSSFENVPKREEKTHEEMKNLRDEIRSG